MELLWGTGERPTRGPKPGLTLDAIVTTAVTVADTDGLAAVSMRRVATELGVGTMSLYRYVPGKAELLDLMLDKVVEFDLSAHPPADQGWRAALTAVAHGSRRLYQQHPWLLQVDQARPILGPNALDGMEYALQGLSGTRLTGREKIHVLVALDGFVTGVTRVEVNQAQAEKRSGISDAAFWKAQEPVLTRVMESGRYPQLAALPEDAFEEAGDDIFELGLTRLLDGLAPFIEGREG